MSVDQETAEVLPETKTRAPISYLLLYKDADGNLEYAEKDRAEMKKFINTEMKASDTVVAIYRTSGQVEMKKKVVLSF